MSGKNSKSQALRTTYGNQTISYNLIQRDTHRITITVHPDKRVIVTAPIDRSMDEIRIRVKKKAPWISKQLAYFEQFQPLPVERKYVSGETHYYLGRQYRLKVIKDGSETVKLVGPYIRIFTKDRHNVERIRELLDQWYLDHARAIFDKRLQKCLDMARSLNIEAPPIIVRKLSKRWGSCTKAGKIVLNTELIKAPLYCIEYVIMHELCHLKAPNHNAKFYKLMSRYMPHWERRKKRLENFVL